MVVDGAIVVVEARVVVVAVVVVVVAFTIDDPKLFNCAIENVARVLYPLTVR